ncbi:MAG: HTTM domain-containing protein [Bacteroidetes bacterium]|nr:HTTM domain-containing protein [Bacteroidota bacterium]
MHDLESRLKIKDPIINAEIMVSYNGRPFVYFIDPNVNLAKVTYNPYSNNSWVMPKPE